MARKKNATRADGRIAVQVYIGRDEWGKRKYKTVYGKTQKIADEKALQIKIALNKGLDVAASNDTFASWAKQWLDIKSTEISNGRLVAYQSALKHLLPRIGHMPIAKVRTIDIKQIITALAKTNPTTKKPTAYKTLSNIKSVALQIFQTAVENRIIDYNPAIALKIPDKALKNKKRALYDHEQQWILDTPHKAQCAAMIMMYSGLRRGELAALTWSDIDLTNNTITINKAAEVIGGKFIVKDCTKTEAGMRIVDIPERLADFLRAEPRTSMLVCPRTNGQVHSESSWRRMWESYLADLNIKYGDFADYETFAGRKIKSKFDPVGVPFVIPKITPHWLRHTFCTLLYLAGTDLLTMRDQMGHKDIKTTLTIYTHLENKYKRKASNKLNTFLDDASQMQVNQLI